MNALLVAAVLFAQTGVPPSSLPAPAAEPPGPPRYGARGSSEIAIGLGYSSRAGFIGSGGYRYFVVDGTAPGLEATYLSGGSIGPAVGMILGTLRLVPIRTERLALVLTGQAGRVMLADHRDGWGAGGGAGLLVMFSPGAWLEIGYEALQLLPQNFCADLSRCVLHGPVFGLRLVL